MRAAAGAGTMTISKPSSRPARPSRQLSATRSACSASGAPPVPLEMRTATCARSELWIAPRRGRSALYSSCVSAPVSSTMSPVNSGTPGGDASLAAPGAATRHKQNHAIQPKIPARTRLLLPS